MKLLLVEDEQDLSDALVTGLQMMKYVVDVAYDGEEGLELYQQNEYDVIILDLNLPVLDGIQVLKAIREKDSLQRVIILSARTSLDQRLEGLDSGANDYLCKPFDFLELEARIRCLLRRKFLQQDSTIQIGDFHVDTAGKKVTTAAGTAIPLAPKEYAILEYLVMHLDEPVSAETLIEHVWHEEVNIFTDSVKVHVSNLRRKLREATGAEHVSTLRGFGYMIRSEG